MMCGLRKEGGEEGVSFGCATAAAAAARREVCCFLPCLP